MWKKDKKTDVSNVAFEGAKVALSVFVDEYSKECDRKIVVENKIISLVTIELAIMTVFVPIIPFGCIKDYLFNGSNLRGIVTTIACIFLFLSIVLMVISFVVLISAVKIQDYNRVDIEELDLEENLKQDANSVEKGLCDHYKEVTLKNSFLNDKKARKHQKCLPMIIYSFLALVIGTVLLKI